MTRPLARVPRSRLVSLARSDRLAICLDVDGTLAPIVGAPSAARVPPETRGTLRRLRRHDNVTLIVISGRRADDARRVVGVRVDWTLGNHGFEMAVGDRAPQGFAPGVRRGEVRRAAARVARAVADLERVTLEDKGWTLSVHFRRAGARVGHEVWRRVRHATRGLSVRLYGGKRVVEVRPAITWNKGIALGRLLTRIYGRLWPARAEVVFAGDDVTDEHVFQEIARQAMTIKVGTGRTRAGYRTRSPATLAHWLAHLEHLLP